MQRSRNSRHVRRRSRTLGSDGAGSSSVAKLSVTSSANALPSPKTFQGVMALRTARPSVQYTEDSSAAMCRGFAAVTTN